MPIVSLLVANVVGFVITAAFWWAVIGLFTGRFYLFSPTTIQGSRARVANVGAMVVLFLADGLLLWLFITYWHG
jgi:hypothetical protein